MRKQVKIYLCALFALCAISCSRKSIPTATPLGVTVNSNCDSLISAAMAKIEHKDTTGDCTCREIELDNIRLSQSLSEAQKQAAQYKQDLINKPTETTVYNGKIKNSFNDITKNSNNSNEVVRLKNSILIKDSAIASLQAENIALNGKLKQKAGKGSVIGDSNDVNNAKIKAKSGSAIGDGNKIDNRKSNKFWLGFLVATGIYYSLKILLELLKRYFPISIPIVSFIQKFLP